MVQLSYNTIRNTWRITTLKERIEKCCFDFFHKIMGCVNLIWKENLFNEGMFSKHVTISDEPLTLFVMRDYDKIPSKIAQEEGQTGGRKTGECNEIF